MFSRVSDGRRFTETSRPSRAPKAARAGVFCHDMSMNFDDPALEAAMRSYLEACTAVAAASNDVDLISCSEVKATAGLTLRKRLLELGWSAPVRQRTST